MTLGQTSRPAHAAAMRRAAASQYTKVAALPAPTPDVLVGVLTLQACNYKCHDGNWHHCSLPTGLHTRGYSHVSAPCMGLGMANAWNLRT